MWKGPINDIGEENHLKGCERKEKKNPDWHMQYCNISGWKKQVIAELLKRNPERSESI